ncbi:MAG TPA: UDP-glucose/GDP-mannose dehydrogenase family protein, partial [Candidatus Hydrogenedentes bacterium]|nr:UDP-glucose/GDP-mannose dehydrogenase family protein [Candidatus Hydrogenedentota bacterium]
YKGDVDDLRESPSLALARLLGERGCEVRAHDPLAQRAPLPNLPAAACLDGADLLLVATAHSVFAELDPADAAARMRGRRVYDAHRLLPAGRWADAGFAVEVLGVG